MNEEEMVAAGRAAYENIAKLMEAYGIDWDNGERTEDYATQEDIEKAIQQTVLNIEVRSGWQTVDTSLEPSEFFILLQTGSPNVCITGELNCYGETIKAKIQIMHDAIEWVDYFEGVNMEILIDFCRHFYFNS
jgi:hypothetical protein